MMLVLGKNNQSRSTLLAETTPFIHTDQMLLKVKGKSTLKPTEFVSLFKKHWAINEQLDTQAPLNSQLATVLDCLSKNQQSCVLVIDYAHLLPISVLAAICHLSFRQENQSISKET